MLLRYTYKFLLGGIFLLLVFPVFSQTLDALECRKKTAEKEIAYINSLLGKTGSKKASNLEELNLLQAKINHRRYLVRDVEAQIGIVNGEISQTRKDITSLQTELNSLKDAYASLISAIYTKRRNSTWLMYVFASDDLSQAYRCLKYFRSFADLAVFQGEQVKAKTVELEEKRKELEEKRKELAVVQKEREAEVKELGKDEARLKELQKELEKQEKGLKESLKKQQANIRSLNAEIARLVNAEVRKASGNTSSSGGYRELPAAERELSNKFEANRGKLPWPLKRGTITLKFGTNKHPLFKSITFPPNNGIDISTEAASDVVSVFAGEVVRVFPFQSYGNCVMIRHGEFFTLYCRLNAIKVKVGDKVNTGDSVGTLDIADSGNSLLHFEFWKSTKGSTVPQNPELWLAPRK
ncbi:MAG: peptidoglycan DD-metalloendopeptidase family protein [Prevotellaceae bacterium]|jgi:septal ring factor EnvC (AmiA/AmiB activator)|nr:peptidoglycan DD-metalloendopeptidase family protein [Prevotellaceae bacterium]